MARSVDVFICTYLVPDVQAVLRREIEVGLQTSHANALVSHVQPRIAATIEHCETVEQLRTHLIWG
jgi:hypothetical protein